MTRPANPLPALEASTSRAAVIRNVLAVAKSQVGYREGRESTGWSNDNIYSHDLNGWHGYAWCVDFANWCVEKAGYGSLIYRTSSCSAYYAWAKSKGLIGNVGNQPPAAGDLIAFTGGLTGHRHFGIVADVRATDLVTYEGNTNDSGSPEGDGVYRKIRPRADGAYDTIRLDWDAALAPTARPNNTKAAPKHEGWARITGLANGQTVRGRKAPSLSADVVWLAPAGHQFYYVDIVHSVDGTFYKSNKGTYYSAAYVTKGR